MKKLSITLISAWSWFVFAVCLVLWLPLMAITWLVTAPFDPPRYWTGYLFRRLPVVHQRLNPLWKFRISGTMPDNPRNPYVVVSNHESFVDILLISHLPWEMKWMSKKEMFKIPVGGWLMQMARDIKLDRGNRESAQAAMDACADMLKQHVSVMVFPEGTRSTTGEMLPFKDGAFKLALEAGVPILPLAVRGTAEGLRKHDWRFGKTTAEVRVLEPVSTEGLTLDDLDDLRERVRTIIQDEVRVLSEELNLVEGEPSR